MNGDYQDEGNLKHLYHEKGLTTYEIADKFDCTQTTIRYWMDKHDIKLRDISSAQTRGKQQYHDEDTLRDLYHGENMSATEIADKFGVSQSTITRWLSKHGVQTRTPAESRTLRKTNAGPKIKGPYNDPDWLREKYHNEGMTLAEIAKEAGLESEGAILRHMQKHGIERRSSGDYLRKPDTIKTAKHDNHEQISFCVDGCTHYYDVHRLLAIAVWGLDEVAGEIVHHKNGIGWHNRPTNLELIDSQSEHAKLHNEMRERDDLGRYK